MSGFQIWLSGDDLRAVEMRQIAGVGDVALIDLEQALSVSIDGAARDDSPRRQEMLDRFHSVLSAAIVKLDDHRKAKKG